MSRFPHGNDCGMVAGIASARSYTVRIRGSGGPGGRTIGNPDLVLTKWQPVTASLHHASYKWVTDK